MDKPSEGFKRILEMSDEDWIKHYVTPCAIAARNQWRAMHERDVV